MGLVMFFLILLPVGAQTALLAGLDPRVFLSLRNGCRHLCPGPVGKAFGGAWAQPTRLLASASRGSRRDPRDFSAYCRSDFSVKHLDGIQGVEATPQAILTALEMLTGVRNEHG